MRNGIIVWLLLLVAYLGASMVAPETVPRPTVLPRPDGEVYYVDSDRQGCPPYRAYTFWNDTEGIFWVKRHLSHGDGCILVAG